MAGFADSMLAIATSSATGTAQAMDTHANTIVLRLRSRRLRRDTPMRRSERLSAGGGGSEASYGVYGSLSLPSTAISISSLFLVGVVFMVESECRP